MSKPTVHIVVKAGFVEDAFADCDVDVVVYDLDCPDSEQKAIIVQEIEKARANCQEVEIQ